MIGRVLRLSTDLLVELEVFVTGALDVVLEILESIRLWHEATP